MQLSKEIFTKEIVLNLVNELIRNFTPDEINDNMSGNYGVRYKTCKLTYYFSLYKDINRYYMSLSILKSAEIGYNDNINIELTKKEYHELNSKLEEVAQNYQANLLDLMKIEPTDAMDKLLE